MPSDFREIVTRTLPSPDALDTALGQMDSASWQGVAGLFAARLPEFDAVLALPGAGVLAASVARARGVPLAHSAAELSAGGGEVIAVTPQLGEAREIQALAGALERQGWTLLLVAAAVERTSKGARTLLGELGVPVRAAVQLADTPGGLVFERRSPDRWSS